MLTYPNIFVNDYAMQFFRDHGYPDSSYNDGMLAWLRDFYGVTGSTLPDLLARYRGEYGDDFVMRVLAKSAVPISLVEPAATFINATPSSAAGGNDTLLTSAGVHGLTSAVSVGASIFISAGAGWTVGFHTITAIAVDTTGTTIQIDTPFDAGFGTPTIALASTEVTLVSIVVPSLNNNSIIQVEFSAAGTISSNSKRWRLRHESTNFLNLNTTTSPYICTPFMIANRGNLTSQTGSFTSSSTVGYGNGSVAPVVGTIDTSSPTTLNITAEIAQANEIAMLDRYIVILYM